MDWQDVPGLGPVAMGTVVLPRSLGFARQRPDGWWEEVFSDWIDLDRHGREIGRAPHVGPVRLRWD